MTLGPLKVTETSSISAAVKAISTALEKARSAINKLAADLVTLLGAKASKTQTRIIPLRLSRTPVFDTAQATDDEVIASERWTSQYVKPWNANTFPSSLVLRLIWKGSDAPPSSPDNIELDDMLLRHGADEESIVGIDLGAQTIAVTTANWDKINEDTFTFSSPSGVDATDMVAFSFLRNASDEYDSGGAKEFIILGAQLEYTEVADI